MTEHYTEQARRRSSSPATKRSRLAVSSSKPSSAARAVSRRAVAGGARASRRARLSLEGIRQESQGAHGAPDCPCLSRATTCPSARTRATSSNTQRRKPNGCFTNSVGTEHLLLGLLREDTDLPRPSSRAGTPSCASVRDQIVTMRSASADCRPGSLSRRAHGRAPPGLRSLRADADRTEGPLDHEQLATRHGGGFHADRTDRMGISRRHSRCETVCRLRQSRALRCATRPAGPSELARNRSPDSGTA